MGDRYLVRIEVWPHSTNRGREVDQIQAGARSHDFEVRADSMRGALSLAELIASGIATNPIVWETPIKEIRQLGHDEHVRRNFEQHDRELQQAAKLQMPAATASPLTPGHSDDR